MSEKGQDNIPQEAGRRKVIKQSMQLAAAAYVAPITLQLLTATRATAQSAVSPAACTCATFDLVNDTGFVLDIEYDLFDCDGRPVSGSLSNGERITLNALVGATLEIWEGEVTVEIVCDQPEILLSVVLG